MRRSRCGSSWGGRFRISVDKFHVSPCNMRADEPFGIHIEDKNLVEQLRHGKIEQPFKVRPEKKGYVVSNITSDGVVEFELKHHEGFGVYLGKRRYSAEIVLAKKVFVVGEHFQVNDISEEEAREASFIENWGILKKDPNPISRARALRDTMAGSTRTLRGWATRWGTSPSTLSEYVMVLQLSERMQQVLAKGLVSFSDGLRMARMKLGETLQDELAELLESEGLEAFKKELARVAAGKEKRGIPAGVYDIDRLVWDRRNRNEMDRLKIVDKAAEKRGMTRPEYEKDFIMRHIEEIEEEAK